MNRAAAILVLVAIAITFAFGIATRTAESSDAMRPFVLIYRQLPKDLSEADLRRRAEEVRAWAQEKDGQGRNLDPKTLGADGAPLSSILFLEARDMADAVEVARSHPGLRYGVVSVEVRAAPPR